MSEPTTDPFQLIHDDVGLSWDDVNAIAAVLDAAGFDIEARASQPLTLDVERLANVLADYELANGHYVYLVFAKGEAHYANPPEFAQVIADAYNKP